MPILCTSDLCIFIRIFYFHKLASLHHQQTNIQLFTGRMPFLCPNWHCQIAMPLTSTPTDNWWWKTRLLSGKDVVIMMPMLMMMMMMMMMMCQVRDDSNSSSGLHAINRGQLRHFRPELGRRHWRRRSATEENTQLGFRSVCFFFA